MNITWNARGYEKDFSFVPAFGADAMSPIDAAPQARVLDLGCGNGTLTAELASRGYDAFGIDASPEMIARARATHPGLSFTQGDTTSFELERPADAIFSNSMLHWIDREKHPQALARIAAALVPGGQFVFECGGQGCGGRIHAALARAFENHGLCYEMPFYFPTIGEYAPLVEEAGLRVTDAFFFDRPTALKGANGMTDWIHMFVTRPFEGMEPELAELLVAEAVSDLKSELLVDDTWFADYVRLRMRAVKLPACQ